jgi:hypothetical protein
MPQLQPYVSNTPLVVARNLRFLVAGIPVTEMLPIGMVGNVVNDNPETGYISRIGAILSDQIDLYNTVQNTLNQYEIDINSLDVRVTALEISGTTVPSVNSQCYNSNSAILVTDMVELLTYDMCQYKPVLGTPTTLTLGLNTSAPGTTNQLDAFSQNSTLSNLNGWNPTLSPTVADTINNIWLAYFDARAGITKTLEAVTPNCSQVIIDYQAVYSTSTETVNLFFSGYSFIPIGYLDGGSIVTITDGLGGIYETGFDIVNQSTTVDPLALSISGSALTLGLPFYTVNVQSNVANASISTTCVKNVIRNTILQGGSSVSTSDIGNYTDSISGSTATLISGLSYSPRFVQIIPKDSQTATRLSEAVYYITYTENGATLNFVTPIAILSSVNIDWIAYK